MKELNTSKKTKIQMQTTDYEYTLFEDTVKRMLSTPPQTQKTKKKTKKSDK